MVNFCWEKEEGRVTFYLGGVSFYLWEGEERDGGRGEKREEEGRGGKGEGVLFVFTLFRDVGVVAPRFKQVQVTETHHQC